MTATQAPPAGPVVSLGYFGGSAEGDAAPVQPSRLRAVHVVVGVLFLAGAMVASVVVGPADLSPWAVLTDIASKVPFAHVHSGLSATGNAVVWQLRMPRVVLGAMVGAMLAASGASYQGVFSNALADPYLLGIASGAGLGATVAVVEAHALSHLPISPLPVLAFAGGVLAVLATFALSRSRYGQRSTAALLLSGIAVASFFTAMQTFVQERNTQDVAAIFGWILGSVATDGWGQVGLAAPYIAAALVVLLACRRLLDVLSVGDDEAVSMGVNARRVRLVVIVAATLGTAAAVSVSGLIAFVGIIVPHTIRLITGPSYRVILPLSVLCGGGFLVFADLLARTVLSPSEVPLGVVTALLGAPFFLIVLRQSQRSA